MPIKILMPALSPTMTHGNLTKWLKKEGDIIKAGQTLAEIETDKATMEVEAVDEGVLAKILIKEGTENVSVNSSIAILLEEGEDQAVLNEFLKHIEASDKKLTNNSNSHEISQQKIQETKEIQNQHIVPNRIFASPLAKRIAKERSIDLRQIAGSGPYGRIVKVDVEGFASSSNSNNIYRNLQEYSVVTNSTVRKIIAARLLESKQTIPHFYLSIECNVDKLLEIRADLNSTFDSKDQRLSVNDFIILASAKSLKVVKEVNATYEESAIRFYNNVDVSVAVATNDGLITPIIKNADQKNISEISNEMKNLARKAKDNKLMPEEFQGGGFTISNLGMFDINNFSAIINPPQSCILAVGASKKVPVVENDQIKIANVMNVTISCDHRVVDGVVGAKFLSVFKKYIEKPSLMLI